MSGSDIGGDQLFLSKVPLRKGSWNDKDQDTFYCNFLQFSLSCRYLSPTMFPDFQKLLQILFRFDQDAQIVHIVHDEIIVEAREDILVVSAANECWPVLTLLSDSAGS